MVVSVKVVVSVETVDSVCGDVVLAVVPMVAVVLWTVCAVVVSAGTDSAGWFAGVQADRAVVTNSTTAAKRGMWAWIFTKIHSSMGDMLSIRA